MMYKYQHQISWSMADKSHPNIYEIVELFRTEQAATEVSLVQLEAGGVVDPQDECSGKKRKD